MALLEIQELSVEYTTHRGTSRVVDEMTFALEEGRMLGLVGESGCGKTTAGRAILGVLPKNGRVSDGRILFEGNDLNQLSPERRRELRWRAISAVPQSAMDSLNPVYRVGDQIIEILTVRGQMPRKQARERAAELFSLVGLDRKRMDYYPHEFSGGMKQRAVIAAALALNPSVVIADEPVTALDVIVQHQVLRELKSLQSRLGLAILMITHDMAVVAQSCDDVLVMYAGKVVERGPVRRVLLSPAHPYTMGLTNAFPHLHRQQSELVCIEGYPPDLIAPPPGCRFAPRCPFAVEHCRAEAPTPVELVADHLAACHRLNDVDRLREQAREVSTWRMATR